MIHKLRVAVFYGVVALSATALVAGAVWTPALWLLVATGPLALLGVWDRFQKRHAVLRNFPVIGHLRFLLEDVGPELRQYIVESNVEGRPFNRDQRALVYTRAKGVSDLKAFGTEKDVYADEYSWMSHSAAPRPVATEPFRVTVGGPECRLPYDCSIFNISSMSFGSLGANAILALNAGAKAGGFAHWTGEGGISRYHREPGGDLVWQIGTGYFGCRAEDGGFDEAQYAERAADDQVKMIELKLSQGAKPGHGGVLPAAKVSAEIAAARGIPVGVECDSPPGHRAFTTPVGLMELIATLRERSGGKPVGFKLCVGDPVEFMAICKAMLETGVTPDFVSVDGSEGGTGAAPLEFSDRVGMPLKEGLVIVNDALVGAGLRERVRVCAAGKLVSAFEIAQACALGADWANSARGFMFSVGCIQAQRCHTNSCPVGVATQDPRLQRGLVVEDKAKRAQSYHHHTVLALAQVVAAIGVDHPSEMRREHVWYRREPPDMHTLAELFPGLEPGQLVAGVARAQLQRWWDAASPDHFGR